MADVITTQIGALPAAEDVNPNTTFLAIQPGPNGTPLVKATPAQILKGIVDDIGAGTIVAGSVVITSGTANLSITTTSTLTADTVTIKAGTGTLSAATITTAALGTVTATVGTITTAALGTVTISGATTAAAIGATTGTYSGTLSAAGSGTGLAVTNDATVGGKLTITGTTAAGAVTAATLATSGAVTVGDSLAVTGKTTLAAVDTSNFTASGIITGKAAGTGLAITNDGSIGGGLKVGGATTLAAVSGSSMAISGSVSAGTILVTGTATALAITDSASVGGALGVTGAMTAGSVIGASGTITSLNSGTVAVSGAATAGTLAATVAATAPIVTATTVNVTTAVWPAGEMITQGNPLIPGYIQTEVDGDGNIAGGMRKDGTRVFASVESELSQAGTLNVTTSITAPAATLTAGTIGGASYSGDSLIPGWAWRAQDGDGNMIGGIRNSGLWDWSQAKIDTLTVTNLITGGASADNSFVAGSKYLPGTEYYTADPDGNIATALSKSGILRALPKPAIIARAARQIARPTNLLTYTPPQTAPDDTVTSGTTIATLWTMDADFDYVRLVWGIQSTNSVTVSAVIAPTATANDGVNPLDEDGAAQAWTQVKVNNGGSSEYEPWNQNTGSATSIALNTSALTQVWGLTYSDWMQVSSLAQTGGSAYPLLMVRTYMTGSPVAAAVTGSSIYGTAPTVWTRGRTWAAYSASGDYVTTTTGYPSSGSSFGNRWAPLMIQTYSRKAGYQLWGCGDSNMAGTGSVFGLLGFYRRSALAIGGRGLPVVYANFNQAGSSPDIFMTNVENIIDPVKPSGLVMFPFSYNAPATRANLDTYWAKAMVIAHRTMRNGGVPVLVGYPPRDSASADDDTIRRMGLERLVSSGFRAVDPNPLVSTADVPAEWVAGMSDDGMHFSDHGHGVVADLVTAELIDAFGLEGWE